MSEAGDPPIEDDGALAADYVLGVQSREVRQELARRIDLDPTFARLVDSWTARLSPLAAEIAAIPPPSALKERVARAAFGEGSREARLSSWAKLWNDLGVWRGTAATAAALAAICAAAAVGAQRELSVAQNQYVAALQSPAAPPSLIATVNPIGGELAIRGAAFVTAGVDDPTRDAELWLIPQGRDPISLGVIARSGTSLVTVPEALRPELERGAVLAVTLEPLGGSPDGKPSGAPIAAGRVEAL